MTNNVVIFCQDLIISYSIQPYRREFMYRKQKKSWVKHLDFLLIDVICLEFAFFISYFIRLSEEPERASVIRTYYSRLALVLLLPWYCISGLQSRVKFIPDRYS